MLSIRVLFAIAASVALALGTARLRADTLPAASERFANAEVTETPSFQRHVVPLLGRLGCNGRSCHGSFQGRGGLRLSLFGYDFEMDHAALTARASAAAGRRIDMRDPDKSLILQKPTLQVEHEGDERFSVSSWQHHLLRRWIESEAHGTEQPESLSHLEVEPAELLLDSDLLTVPLRVVAVWENDQREDVTPLCRFRSNNDAVATVDADGVVTSTGPGDTHVIAFYDNGIAAVPILRRYPAKGNRSEVRATIATEPASIDSLVLAKLAKLGIEPSVLCSDTEFLRRASIDLTGTLPTPDEIEDFLADPASDKRRRKVDELLDRPTYAAAWANKLCDFTGCNPAQQVELGQETSVQWYMWIYHRLRENMPYDELVRRVVLAKGRGDHQSYDEYAAQTSAYFRADDPEDFSQRETMPHYWTRRSMQEPADAAQAFAHNFLGIRLQCAQCHKHPFAPWTQDDFKDFSRFFESVQFGVAPESQARYREFARQVGMNVRDDKGTAVSQEVLKHAQRGRTIAWRELYIRPRKQAETLRLLQSREVTLEDRDDPRAPIMQWMTAPDNRWFAQAFVNRVWASYFHVGIIDPPDDLNPANPPSNPALLDWLVRGFIQSGYDMKWLHRQIVTSHTYQRSWRPNEANRDDRHNFSRCVPRRLPAEVVYDGVKQALAAVADADEVRNDLTRRAIGELSMRLAGTYAMQVFGKPERAINCDCERVNQPTLLQSIFLQNDPLVDQRLEDSGWLAEIVDRQEAGAALDAQQLVKAAWLRTVSRPPTSEESARALEHLRTSDSTAEGLRDLLWALLNTKEFVLIQ